MLKENVVQKHISLRNEFAFTSFFLRSKGEYKSFVKISPKPSHLNIPTLGACLLGHDIAKNERKRLKYPIHHHF